jgi:hypothetical protein
MKNNKIKNKQKNQTQSEHVHSNTKTETSTSQMSYYDQIGVNGEQFMVSLGANVARSSSFFCAKFVPAFMSDLEN